MPLGLFTPPSGQGLVIPVFNRRSRVRAVVSRASTGLVGQNTSCKAHKCVFRYGPRDGMTYSAVKPID